MHHSDERRNLAENRREFYIQFLEFTRHYPDVQVSLYVPRDDFGLFEEEEWFFIVCELLKLCQAGRLTLVGLIPRLDLLRHFRKIKEKREAGKRESRAAVPRVPAYDPLG